MAEVKIPDDRRYTDSNEWVLIEDGKARVGITDYAQGQLTDIVGVWDLPEVGTEVRKGDICGTIESVKASAELYAPVSGKIIEVNTNLEDTPEVLNEDPYGNGWILLIEMSDPREIEELLSPEEYRKMIEGQ